MELQIQFTKRHDGTVVLRCTREDGTVTWQKHEKHGAFFALHDLTHYAVETVLGFRRGFYGLLAEGWDITDTYGKGDRGKPPVEAILPEHLAGLFEKERSGGAEPLDGNAFCNLIEEMTGQNLGHRFTDAELTAVRQRIATLHQQWLSIPQGSSLELTFDRKQDS